MAPEIDGKIYITEFEGVNDAADLPAPGTLATVEITEAKDYDLIGRVIEFRVPARATSNRPPHSRPPVPHPRLVSYTGCDRTMRRFARFLPYRRIARIFEFRTMAPDYDHVLTRIIEVKPYRL